jgi:hypothetical protein
MIDYCHQVEDILCGPHVVMFRFNWNYSKEIWILWRALLLSFKEISCAGVEWFIDQLKYNQLLKEDSNLAVSLSYVSLPVPVAMQSEA